MTANTKHKAAFEREIKPVRQAMLRWRQIRKPRQPIPNELWRSMSELARDYGVSRVCGALKVNYGALKNRVQGASSAASAKPGQAFVELGAPVLPAAPGCVVDLEDGSGARMTLRLSQANAAEALALIESFWRRER
jgi:hypothetical protein